jgi:hypothetical protein
LSIGTEFDAVVSRMQTYLKVAIGEIEGGGSGESEEALLAGLAEFAARYTMQEQHDVHPSVAAAFRQGREMAPAARE